MKGGVFDVDKFCKDYKIENIDDLIKDNKNLQEFEGDLTAYYNSATSIVTNNIEYTIFGYLLNKFKNNKTNMLIANELLFDWISNNRNDDFNNVARSKKKVIDIICKS